MKFLPSTMSPRPFCLTCSLCLLLAGLPGCAVVTVAGAVTGAAISVTGAVVSTGVTVTGKVIGKAIDVALPDGEGDIAQQ